MIATAVHADAITERVTRIAECTCHSEACDLVVTLMLLQKLLLDYERLLRENSVSSDLDELIRFEKYAMTRLGYTVAPGVTWDAVVQELNDDGSDFYDGLRSKGLRAVLCCRAEYRSTLHALLCGDRFSTWRRDDSGIRLNDVRYLAEILDDVVRPFHVGGRVDQLHEIYERVIDWLALPDVWYAALNPVPRRVAHLLSGLAADRMMDRDVVNGLLDVSHGTGTLSLIVRDRLSGSRVPRVAGYEKSSALSMLAHVNMLLHGVYHGAHELHCRDVLNTTAVRHTFCDTPGDRDCDAMVSVIPFGQRLNREKIQADDPRFDGYAMPPASAADFAYLLLGLRRLRTNGVMVCTLFPGNLTLSGSCREIRQGLCSDNRVEAVISLPGGLFARTGAAADILILRKSGTTKDVLMVDARDACDDAQSLQNTLTDEGIRRILQTCRDRKGEAARIVPIEQIARDDFNLHAAHHVNV